MGEDVYLQQKFFCEQECTFIYFTHSAPKMLSLSSLAGPGLRKKKKTQEVSVGKVILAGGCGAHRAFSAERGWEKLPTPSPAQSEATNKPLKRTALVLITP